jgi:hypothetical protein
MKTTNGKRFCKVSGPPPWNSQLGSDELYWRWYSQWHGKQFGYDGKKLLPGLVGVILAFCAFMIVLCSNSYLRVGEDSIGWKRGWSFSEKQYSYDEIDKVIETAGVPGPAGNVVQRRNIHIVFADGKRWNYEEMLYKESRGDFDEQMIQYLQERSGKKLIHATFVADVAP